jgi:hypothetical protein
MSNTPGLNQHAVPASLIGRFSTDSKSRARERRVWVKDNRSDDPFPRRADNLTTGKNQYGVADGSNGIDKSIDSLWQIYEPQLPELLDLIGQSEPIDGLRWAQVLVPFVAGLFVRNPDFAKLIEPSIPPIPELKINTLEQKAAKPRAAQFQELLTPLMVADWTVLHFDDPVLATNDLGYAPVNGPIGKGYGNCSGLSNTW